MEINTNATVNASTHKFSCNNEEDQPFEKAKVLEAHISTDTDAKSESRYHECDSSSEHIPMDDDDSIRNPPMKEACKDDDPSDVELEIAEEIEVIDTTSTTEAIKITATASSECDSSSERSIIDEPIDTQIEIATEEPPQSHDVQSSVQLVYDLSENDEITSLESEWRDNWHHRMDCKFSLLFSF